MTQGDRMSATSTTQQEEKETVTDDISNAEIKPKETIDASKLAALKAQAQAKKQQEVKMAAKIVSKKERSLNLGFLGSGQAGSRLVESFFQLGYDCVVCNTCVSDLKFINVPDSNKLLLEYGVGGASKELGIGHAAAEAHRGEILQLVN